MQFENKVTLGNVLTMLALVLGLATGYSSIASQLATHSSRLSSAEQIQRERIVISEARAATTDIRLRSSEIAIAGQSSELRSILLAMARIETAIEKLAARP